MPPVSVQTCLFHAELCVSYVYEGICGAISCQTPKRPKPAKPLYLLVMTVTFPSKSFLRDPVLGSLASGLLIFTLGSALMALAFCWSMACGESRGQGS